MIKECRNLLKEDCTVSLDDKKMGGRRRSSRLTKHEAREENSARWLGCFKDVIAFFNSSSVVGGVSDGISDG